MSEIPEGRCVVCRQAWEPCRRCTGLARARKADATMAAQGKTRNIPKPRPENRFSLTKDPDRFPHLIEVKERRDDADA